LGNNPEIYIKILSLGFQLIPLVGSIGGMVLAFFTFKLFSFQSLRQLVLMTFSFSRFQLKSVFPVWGLPAFTVVQMLGVKVTMIDGSTAEGQGHHEFGSQGYSDLFTSLVGAQAPEFFHLLDIPYISFLIALIAVF
jgi:hypothetical protein